MRIGRAGRPIAPGAPPLRIRELEGQLVGMAPVAAIPSRCSPCTTVSAVFGIETTSLASLPSSCTRVSDGTTPTIPSAGLAFAVPFIATSAFRLGGLPCFPWFKVMWMSYSPGLTATPSVSEGEFALRRRGVTPPYRLLPANSLPPNSQLPTPNSQLPHSSTPNSELAPGRSPFPVPRSP